MLADKFLLEHDKCIQMLLLLFRRIKYCYRELT